MGTKYTIQWFLGSQTVFTYRTNSIFMAYIFLWFHTPDEDFAWKSLEIR